MNSSQTFLALTTLVGEWTGEGTGYFPTIDTFAYRERLVATMPQAGTPMLHYLQETWKQTPDGEAPSHIETGFITVTDDGTVEMLNAQGPDRIAVLTGTVETVEGASKLTLLSHTVEHDHRVLSSERHWTWTADTLSYTMAMHTTAVSKSTPHLKATLHRST